MDDMIRCRLFAVDLVKYVLKSENLFWPYSELYHSYKDMISDHKFDSTIGVAVLKIFKNNLNIIGPCCKELLDLCDDFGEDIKFFALSAIPMYFPSGYTTVHFLAFCSMMCGVAAMYSEHCYNQVPDIVSEVITCVFASFVLTEEFHNVGAMQELGTTAFKFLRCLSKKERTEKLT